MDLDLAPTMMVPSGIADQTSRMPGLASEPALEVALQLFRKGSATSRTTCTLRLATQAGQQPLWTFDKGAAKVSGAQLLAKA